MSGEREFRIRPGRIRSTRAQHGRPFIAQALVAARKAGGGIPRSGHVVRGARSRFGLGQRASIQANRLITSRSRGAVVKARVVRHTAFGAQLGTHLDYLRRDGVTREGEKGRLFGPGTQPADGRVFAGRCAEDRHHFRFIVSPEDAREMADLRSFTGDLVGRMQKDLGTRLDWIAVDHWNTGHPHIHLIVRGVRDDGEDLVIARSYIKEGMRDRARDLITQELGPRTDLDIRRNLERQIEAERWTQLDRQLMREAATTGFIDLAPRAGRQPDEFHALKIGRLRFLEVLGAARQVGQAQWCIEPEAEVVLRQLGERGDIIRRMHRALSEVGIERAADRYVLAAEKLDVPFTGRLVERGLDDELTGTAYAVVDGVDGRTHHVRLSHLAAAGDSAPGSIVELRTYDDARGDRRVAIAVRSDLDIKAQVRASGATWLDRHTVAREPVALADSGFGADVRKALEQRADHLIGEGLANRDKGGRVVFARRLLDTLRDRELAALGDKLAAETVLPFHRGGSGEFVAGIYRRRFDLATGRFAMIDDGLGFQLVPWSPTLERELGRHVSGVARIDGGIDWSFGRRRGLGL